MSGTVIILGGGVGGMSAAHELAERGFRVRVFERQDLPGGKARSVAVAGTGTGGRPDLPGEHGFRFFPRFYRHVTDTMRRIPVGGGRSAFDNLVQASREELAVRGKRPFVMPAWFPRSLGDLALMLRDHAQMREFGIPADDMAFFTQRLWQLMTSCAERTLAEYERVSWWDYLEADRRSAAFRTCFVEGLTRNLVAAQPKTASTQVGGEVLTELIYATTRPGTSDDRLLNAPTNDAWLTPWLAHLRALGVEYHLDAEVRGLAFDGTRVTGVTVRRNGTESVERADWYVAAVPVERMNRLLTDAMIAADPVLGGIRTLAGDVQWMNGIQFYLAERVPIANGHVTYMGTPWALTSISQAQFWSGVDLPRYGDGTVRDILSVDISDWDTPGVLEWPDGTGGSRRKAARECSKPEIAAEVWAQLQQCVNVDGAVVLPDAIRRGWYVDGDITRVDGRDADAEPLLVNRPGRWALRPDAHTAIPNLFLASDYVRTNTNLATMEAANEAARRAVNGIIAASGAGAAWCGVWPLYEPWLLAPLRWHDRRRFALGLPWDPRPPFVVRIAHMFAHAAAKLAAVLGLSRR